MQLHDVPTYIGVVELDDDNFDANGKLPEELKGGKDISAVIDEAKFQILAAMVKDGTIKCKYHVFPYS